MTRWMISTLVSVVVSAPVSLFAQNWSFDARRIALGSVGDHTHPAAGMIDEYRPYRRFVLPFGLIQVLRDIDRFNPGSDAFDPVRAIEYAASPLHYVIGRGTDDSGSFFITDLVTGELSRDLSVYAGFRPASNIVAEGLAAPNWGKTFRVSGDRASAFQGIYVGAGPYLGIRTAFESDPRLVDALNGARLPNTSFLLGDESLGEAALAVSVGYRARFALPGGDVAGRNGIYVAGNYNYLHGFRYASANFAFRFDTDAAGLITVLPTTTPAVILYQEASSGRGRAVDIGLGVVANRWEVGFGAVGIANRIDWDDVESRLYTQNSLVAGGEFDETIVPGVGEVTVELPVHYTGNAAYHAPDWSVLGDVSHGFQGAGAHLGFEWRFDRVELRAGGRYTSKRWQPAGGIGFNFSRRVSLDVATFGTSTNLEQERKYAVAASIRLNRLP